MSFLNFGKKKIEDEEREEKRRVEMLALIDQQIAKIKKDGKYHGDYEDDLSAHVSNNWGSEDTRYPAKYAVLEALQKYINSSKTNQDLKALQEVLGANPLYDVAKVGRGLLPEEDFGMVHNPQGGARSATGKLVLQVLSQFPSEDTTKKLIQDQIARIKKAGNYNEAQKRMLKTDVHYTAKLTVLTALQTFMNSNKTLLDKNKLEGILSHDSNKSYKKKQRGFKSSGITLSGSGTTTNDLVLYVKDNFYPPIDHTKEMKRRK